MPATTIKCTGEGCPIAKICYRYTCEDNGNPWYGDPQWQPKARVCEKYISQATREMGAE